MSAPRRVDSNKDAVERPTTSALGFLTRGIRSVSSLVTNISTIFSSSSQDEPQSSPIESDEGSVHSGQTPETDASQNTYGSSPEASSSQEDSEDSSISGPIAPTTTTTSASAPRRTEVVYPRIVRTPARRLARVSASLASNSAVVPAISNAAAEPSSLSRTPIRREGAFYGQPPAPQAPAIPGRRPRVPLRREPVYIEGQDPAMITPASELRGRDPRTIRENRYWLDSWGRLPTLEDIVPRGVPDARTVIGYLQRRYGYSTEPFWQAVDHIFPLPDGEEYRPRFERIVRTSEWRSQSEDWVGGIEPVDRVREPARADDAADSEAEMESVGYLSDDNMDAFDDGSSTSTSAAAGPSSTALVPASAVASSSSPSYGQPSLSPTSSALATAGPSTQRKRKRGSDSDSEHSTTSNPDEGRPTTRRRLSSPPPSPFGSSSTTRRRRQTARTHPRGASFTYPQSRPAQTRVARPPSPPAPPPPAPPSPSPSLALEVPTIIYTPASPCPSVTVPSPRMPSAAAAGLVASAPASGMGADASSSSSATQFLAPPSPHRPRRSRRHRQRSPTPSPQPPAPPATISSEPAGASAASGSSAPGLATQATAPSRGRSTNVARTRKRAHEEVQEGEGSGAGNQRSPEDAGSRNKRPKRGR